jgi:hypothetical protein
MYNPLYRSMLGRMAVLPTALSGSRAPSAKQTFRGVLASKGEGVNAQLTCRWYHLESELESVPGWVNPLPRLTGPSAGRGTEASAVRAPGRAVTRLQVAAVEGLPQVDTPEKMVAPHDHSERYR